MWFLVIGVGLTQILTASVLFEPFRRWWRGCVRYLGEALIRSNERRVRFVAKWSNYIDCPMCTGVPVGGVLSLVMGVSCPLPFEGVGAWVLSVLLCGVAVSAVAYPLVMAGRYFENGVDE